MGNPYQARRRLRNGVREEVPTLPVARLSALGASPQVLQEATDRWATLSEEERVAILEELAVLTDDEVRVRIGEMEEELSGTLTGVVNASISVPKGSIDTITSWVGTDRERASAALQHERLTRKKPRQKLVDALEKLVR